MLEMPGYQVQAQQNKLLIVDTVQSGVIRIFSEIVVTWCDVKYAFMIHSFSL